MKALRLYTHTHTHTHTQYLLDKRGIYSKNSTKPLVGAENRKNANAKMKMAGITLIALVVTIVVLLILAGVTISAVFSENGIISQAQKTKEKQEIAVLKDQVEIIKTAWELDRSLNDTIGIENLWQRLINAEIISGTDKIEGPIEDGENEKYILNTIPGYKIDLILSGDIKQDTTPPTITIISSSSTSNSIAVTVNAADADSGMPENPIYVFYLKNQIEDDRSYVEIQNGESPNLTKTKLSQNTTYTVKVETQDIAGNTGTVTQDITTKGIEGANDGLQTGAIIASTPTWSNGTASITLSTDTGLTIQWQKSGISGAWTTGTSVTGINYNETIFARLTDGNNYGDEASVTVLDGNNPQTATISLGATTANTGVNVTATVTHNDNESGPNIASCKWVYNTNSGTIGTNPSSYTGTFSSNGQLINLNASTPGSYYLHVLTVDKAGRATESIKGPITVKQLVTGISLSPTSATIETEKTQTLTVTVSPSNASNKNVTWTSSNPGVATVSNGVVTGESAGTATITATAADGSGKSATCSITVKAALAADGNFNSTKGINTPKIGTGMTPIKWNGSSWVNTTGDDPEWYDYSNKKWANAKTSDGSMWVWIPRYAYQITMNYSNGGSGVSGNINIKFMKGTTNEAADGMTSWNNTSGSRKWNIHPAFTYGSTVPGIWVAKFEASQNGSTLKVVPGVSSWRSITISNIYSTCLNYNTTLNSHQMKNSEWGAVAYLAQSTYGKNSEVWINPNSNFLTGQAGTGPSVSSTTSTYAYTDTTYGVNASTTGNVTGIYDMSGGAWEYVAAYVNNGNGNLSSYGSNLVNGAAKTKDVYSTSSDSQSNNYNAAASVYGDAVYETSSSYSGSTSWYGDYSYFPYSSLPFFLRGGHYGSTANAGLFYFNGNVGDDYSNAGFRPVLVAL